MTEKATIIVDGDVGPLRQKLREGAAELKRFGDTASSSFAQLDGVMSRASAGMAALMTVLAGGAALRASVEATVTLTRESQALARQFGMTATEASALKVALGDAYIEQETFATAAAKITKVLADDEEAFTKLGIATRDGNGEFRSTLDIMLDVNKRLLAFREGTDRNVEGTKIYGKAWTEVAPVLRLTTGLMEESRAKAAELGLVVGQENVEATTRYRAAMNDVGDVFDAVRKTIGDALLPILTDLGTWFASIGPNVVVGFRASIGTLISMFYGLKFAISSVWEFAKAFASSFVRMFTAFPEIIKRAFQGDFSGARDAWNAYSRGVATDFAEAMKEVTSNATAARDRMMALFNPSTTATTRDASGAASGGGGKGKGDKKGAGAKGDQSFMAYYEGALEEERRLASERDALHEYSKQQELAFWRQILQLAQLSAADRLAIQRKVSGLEIDIRRKAAQDQVALDAEVASGKTALALGEVDARRSAARLLFETDKITKQQLIAQELEFQAQKYNIESKALQDRLALLRADPTSSPAERQRLNDQQLQMEQKFQADRNEILAGLGDKKKGKGDTGESDKLFSGLGNSFGNSLEHMLLQAKSWKDALDTLWKGAAAVFLRVVVTEPAGQWIAMQAKMFAAKLGFLGKEEAAQVLASGKTVATKAGEATAVIGAESAKAGAGAAASQAGIPIIGPALAIGAMVAIVASVMALKKHVKSAAKGYDIPAGVNPMVQLHEQEMVLPAPLSQGLRNIIAQQGGAPAAGAMPGGGGTMNVYAFDSDDVRRFMSKQGHRVADGLALQARNFRFAPRF